MNMPDCGGGPPKNARADIKRASTTLGPRGQTLGSDSTVAASVPCSLEPLAGRELELARQIVANARYEVTMTVDPAWAVTTADDLVVTRCSGGVHNLGIGDMQDITGVEREYRFICSEAV